MTSYQWRRWVTFFLVGLPLQLLVYILYPFVALYFKFYIRGKVGKRLSRVNIKRSLDSIIELGKQDPIRDECFLDDKDSHSAMVHTGIWALRGKEMSTLALTRLVRPNGQLRRIYPTENNVPVSGDCLTTWVYSYSLLGGPKESLRALAKHYMLNCFGLVHFVDGLVSARSSNGGFNWTNDGVRTLDLKLFKINFKYGMNYPAFGPQYYTSAALFALAKKELGGVWHAVYWGHWLVMGGWLWWAAPIIYSKTNLAFYLHYVTALNLNTLQRESSSWMHRSAMRRVVIKSAPSENVQPFMYALGWNSGALGFVERLDGQYMLQCIEQVWPQSPYLDDKVYSYGNDGKFSMMALSAMLFRNDRGWKP